MQRGVTATVHFFEQVWVPVGCARDPELLLGSHLVCDMRHLSQRPQRHCPHLGRWRRHDQVSGKFLTTCSLCIAMHMNGRETDACLPCRAWQPESGQQLSMYTVPTAAADQVVQAKGAILAQAGQPDMTGDPEPVSAAAVADEQAASAANGSTAEGADNSADEQVASSSHISACALKLRPPSRHVIKSLLYISR